MAGKKKFGTFAGVFTPSVLTILGVIMYMRMGWVVGNAGLVGTILIIVLAHVISVSTGLSVSSVATDKRVGAGGIYYILSRSMGIPIGGAIGIALYVGTAFSIALYLIGFAESLNGYLGLDTSINGLRISGSIALLCLTAIALISTSVALKTQFFILAAIAISLVSIFFGTREFAPQSIMTFPASGSAPLEIVFAVFFPAVTGFTAGIAMCGDLKDPKKSIPVGTISAITVGFLIYLGLAAFIAYSVNPEILRSDYNILSKIAFFAPAVVAGIWGATLSSALGGVLGAPRILQAMSVDRVTPRIFGRGRGKNNEPVNALLLVIIIAFSGILIGELDVIARVVSMFYLAAYGFICLSFFLESWANPDFQPAFRVSRWVGMIGFAACFGVMFKLDMIAMFASIIVILGIHFWLQRKQIELDTANVWQSVWEKVVARGLNKLETKAESLSSWNPNIILFSGETEERPHLLEFGKAVAGNTGIVTNFSLLMKGDSDTPLSKTGQIQKDETLERLGIFGRKVQVDNIYDGVENVATTFGFSGVDPNTVMMGWPKTIENAADYAKMTRSLIQLDYNVLYLAFNPTAGFGEHKTIDLWWRTTDSNNAEMMLNISRFVTQSPDWAKAAIRILFVHEDDSEIGFIKTKIANLLEATRIKAEIKIINNGRDRTPFNKIIEIQSANTDLVIIGIPEVDPDNLSAFVEHTAKLIEPLGTTMLVRASDSFNELDLTSIRDELSRSIHTTSDVTPLPYSKVSAANELISEFDRHLSATARHLSESTLSAISSLYVKLIEEVRSKFEHTSKSVSSQASVETIVPEIQHFLKDVIRLIDGFGKENLGSMHDLFESGLHDFEIRRKQFRENALRKIKINKPADQPKSLFGNKIVIHWRAILSFYYESGILPNVQESLYDFGNQTFTLLNSLAEKLAAESQSFIEKQSKNEEDSSAEFNTRISEVLYELTERFLLLEKQAKFDLSVVERDICVELVEKIENPAFSKRIAEKANKLRRKDTLKIESDVSGYADDWFRIQELAHRHAVAELNLAIVGLSIFRINERIKRRVNNTIFSSQRRRIKVLSEALDLRDSADIQNGSGYERKVEGVAEEIVHVNFRNLFDNEEAAILSVSSAVPQDIELITAESLEKLRKCQDEEAESVTLNLAKILNYIVQSSYLTPLQTAKDSLETTYVEIAENIYGCANLYSHLFEQSAAKEDALEAQDTLNEVRDRIAVSKDQLDRISEAFNHDLTTSLHSTIAQLTIRTLLQSEDVYSKVTRQPIIGTGFQKWFEEQKNAARDYYRKLINFITRERQRIDTLRFELSDSQLLNTNEQISDFVASISVRPEVEEELPFYLKRLFADRQVGSAKKLSKKKNREKIRKALDRIERGTSGAIIVLGESLSGKTNYTETLARTMIKGDRYVISPPSRQSFTNSDMHAAFQRAFNTEGTARSILQQAGKNSILVFNDIERWWIKSKGGDTVINYLADIIDEFGSKHYFLLNSSIHSFNILRKVTSLERQLLTTLVIPPPTKSELKKVIMDRYKIAGVELLYEGEPLDKTRKVDALFSEIYSQSHGKIGVALNSWVSNIYRNKEGKLSVAKPSPVEFPNIKDPYWKLVLYYFLIHNRLTDKHLKELFPDPVRPQLQNTLDEMEKAELVYKQFYNTYVLKKAARTYVEIWLKDLKILK